MIERLFARPNVVLRSALFKKMVGVAGPSDFYAQCLFMLMNRQYIDQPSKKKAILIHEVFLAGNSGTQTTNWVFLPTEKERMAASPLNFNTEAGGGLKPHEVHYVHGQIALCKEALEISEKKGRLERFFTNKYQKIEWTLGSPPNQTFASLERYISGLLTANWDKATELDFPPDFQMNLVRKALAVVGPAAKAAGFNMGKIGLKPDGTL